MTRYGAVGIGLFVALVGLIGIVFPEILQTVAARSITSRGLYIVAVLRVAIGLFFIFVAPRCRRPLTMRIIGTIALIAGVTTPLFGVDRARMVLGWATRQGPAFVRGIGVLVMAIGGLIVSAAAAPRKQAE